MAARKKAKGRGGWRPGAGRKSTFKERARITFDLEREHLDALTELAERRAASVSQVLRDAVAALLRRQRK